MNANAPPATHTTSMPRPSPTNWATRTGTKKMPPPMTFETTMADASKGPSRRSSDTAGADGNVVAGLEPSRATEVLRALLSEELPRDLDAVHRNPLRGALLREDLGIHVVELTVLQHFYASLRRIGGIPELRPH